MGDGFDVDVQDGNNLGGFVVNEDGHFQVGGGCCEEPSEDPCTDCDGAQPPATVTIAPGLACEDSEGEYAYTLFADDEDFCYWVWTLEDPGDGYDRLLSVEYCKAEATWCAQINLEGGFPRFGQIDDCPCGTGGEHIGDAVACIGSTLIGEFDLTGVSGCAGETAHVVLNT